MKWIFFLKNNPDFKGQIFIVYGAGHDLSHIFKNISFERGQDYELSSKKKSCEMAIKEGKRL